MRVELLHKERVACKVWIELAGKMPSVSSRTCSAFRVCARLDVAGNSDEGKLEDSAPVFVAPRVLFVLLPQPTRKLGQGHFWGGRCMFGVLAGSVEDTIRAVPPSAPQERMDADRPSWHARQHRRVLSLGQFVHDQLELLGRARRDCAEAIRVHSLP